MEVDFYQVSLKVVLFNEEGKMLVLKGKSGTDWEGFHDIPGGRINTSEFDVSFSEILKREVSEELGDVDVEINAQPVSLGRCEFPSGRRVFYIFFEGTFTDPQGEIRLSDEHDGYAWVHIGPGDLERLFVPGVAEGLRAYCVSKGVLS